MDRKEIMHLQALNDVVASQPTFDIVEKFTEEVHFFADRESHEFYKLMEDAINKKRTLIKEIFDRVSGGTDDESIIESNYDFELPELGKFNVARGGVGDDATYDITFGSPSEHNDLKYEASIEFKNMGLTASRKMSSLNLVDHIYIYAPSPNDMHNSLMGRVQNNRSEELAAQVAYEMDHIETLETIREALIEGPTLPEDS
jgi:predicted P-loop ATPase/GTPase